MIIDEMGIKYVGTVNGQDAWEKLNEIAACAEANQNLGECMGTDAYVAKFEPRELASTLVNMMCK